MKFKDVGTAIYQCNQLSMLGTGHASLQQKLIKDPKKKLPACLETLQRKRKQ